MSAVYSTAMMDDALFLLSSAGVLPWRKYRDFFDELCRRHNLVAPSADDQDDAWTLSRLRRDARRAMSALGHAEFLFGPNDEVAVAPPVLARLPRPLGGPFRAVFAGARSPRLLGAVADAVAELGLALDVVEQPWRATTAEACLPAPARVRVEGELQGIFALAQRLGDAERPVRVTPGTACRAVSGFAAGLDRWRRSVAWQVGQVECPGELFDLTGLRFVEPPRSGMRREISPLPRLYRSRQHGIPRHYLVESGRYAVVDPDWARWQLLASHSRQALWYDCESAELVVARGVPLPLLWDRAAALASGWAPHQRVDRRAHGWVMVYRDVPVNLAGQLAVALGQTHEELSRG